MPDGPAPDVISGGRDPDDDPRRASRPRLLAVAAAAVLITAGIAVHLSAGHSGPVPSPPKPPAAPSPALPSSVALAAPSMLHGTPLRAGGVPGTLLFLGGADLRLLTVRANTAASPASIVPDAGDARYPLGPDPAVQQVISVAGGVVALIYSHGTGARPDIGDVLFVPVGASGVGRPRVIARANYIAAAPDGRDVWVEQAGAPWGNGPASGPAWLAGPDGRRLSAVRPLANQVLVAATAGGLLIQDPDHNLALLNPVTGRARYSGIPADATIVATDADQVVWQAPACPPDCTLHVSDVRGGPGTQLALPPHTVIDPGDTSDFDPAGRRLAVPLDIIGAPQGVVTGTAVYIADLTARTLTPVPGGPVPVAALPAVMGALPVGSPDVVSARWSADGTGLWIVATDGLYFQAGYWTGHSPLRVLTPQAGLAYKFGIPGAG